MKSPGWINLYAVVSVLEFTVETVESLLKSKKTETVSFLLSIAFRIK